MHSSNPMLDNTHIFASTFSFVAEDELTTDWIWCWKQILDNNLPRSPSVQMYFVIAKFLACGTDVEDHLFFLAFSLPYLDITFPGSHHSEALIASFMETTWAKRRCSALTTATFECHKLPGCCWNGFITQDSKMSLCLKCRTNKLFAEFPSSVPAESHFLNAPYRKLFCNHKPALSVSHDPRQDYTAVPGTVFPLCEPFNGF